VALEVMAFDSQISSSFIPSAVVPVVIISACGLLCLTFYNRLAFIVTRLRALQRERLGEYKDLFRLEQSHKSKLARQEAEHFLSFLEHQTVDVLKRALYLRNCLFCLILSIFSLVITSHAIGLSLIYPSIEVAVLFFFVLGLFLMLSGLYFALREIILALRPIQMESDFVQHLVKNEFQDGDSAL